MIRFLCSHSRRVTLAVLLFALTAAPGRAGDASPSRSDFAWRVTAPSTLDVRSGNAIKIAVSAGASPATKVAIGYQLLSEKVVGSVLPDFFLCKTEICSTSDEITASAKGETTLYLVPTPGQAEPDKHWWEGLIRGLSHNGEFIGKIMIAAAEKPEGEELSVDLSITSWVAWLTGAIVLVIGVTFSNFLTPLIADPNAGQTADDEPQGSGGATAHNNAVDADSFSKSLMRLVNQDPRTVSRDDEHKKKIVSGLIADMRKSALRTAGTRVKARIYLRKSQAQLLLSLTSIALGLNSLVLTSSFGTWKDYFACLLWGIGAPLGSKAITSLVAIATRS